MAEVDILTTKEFLQQVFVAHRTIEVRLEQIIALQSMATKTTTIIQCAPSGTNSFGSRVENAVIKIQEAAEHLAEEVNRLIEVTKKVSAAIAQVPNPNERFVLEFRYLCFFSWPQIAAVMKTGARQIFRFHRSALKFLSANVSKSQ